MTESEIDKNFGEFIRAEREKKEWEVYTLSTKTKIHCDRIRSLERGVCRKSVTRTECIRLADALGLDINKVMVRAAIGDESHGVSNFNGE